MRNTNMSKEELRGFIKQLLRTVCQNVEDSFVFPEERSQLQSAFPYVTLVFGEMQFSDGTNRMIQKISVIGFVRGKEEDIIAKQDDLENKIFKALYKNELFQCSITSGSNSNLFRPFGFDAGIFLPYAGVRFELEVPIVKVIQ